MDRSWMHRFSQEMWSTKGSKLKAVLGWGFVLIFVGCALLKLRLSLLTVGGDLDTLLRIVGYYIWAVRLLVVVMASKILLAAISAARVPSTQ